jgi:hypothetical protein
MPLFHRKLAESHAACRRYVCLLAVLYDPSGDLQKFVDLLARPILRGDGHDNNGL